MEGWKIRTVEEYWQLRARIERLSKMIDQAENGTLEFKLNCPISLLKEQLKAMNDYAGCIEERFIIEFTDDDVNSEAFEDICLHYMGSHYEFL